MSIKFVKALKPAETYTHTHTHTSSLLLSFLSVILISSPSYSSGITSNANSATCNNSTLETYTGTSNLQANWSANEITVKWYADSEAQQPMTTNTCFYGPNSALTIPPASSMVNLKPGYTFAGWRVRCFASSVCGLTSSDAALEAIRTAYKTSNSSSDYDNSTMYGLTELNTWATEYSHGVVRGVASCNNTDSTRYYDWNYNGGTIESVYQSCSSDALKSANTFSTDSVGRYCWCKMTSYTPVGGETCNVPDSVWVFRLDMQMGDSLMTEEQTASNCAGQCANWCSMNGYLYGENWTRALFGVK